MTKMQPEIKTKWLASLRSGKYAQATGVLFDGESKFCCLGVLCDVVSPDWEYVNDEGKAYISHELGDSNELLDSTFREEIGISSDAQETLTKMNDGENGVKYSFAQIADWIEENL